MKRNAFLFFALPILVICLCFSLTSCGGTTVSVKYELDGGELADDAPTSYKSGDDTDFSKVVPTKENYKFDGWYIDEDFEKPFDAATFDKESVTLYAKWTGEEFEIEYKLDGGTCDGLPTKHVFGERTSLSSFKPEKAGYIFVAWCSDSALTKNISNIADDVAGKVTVYAKYKPAPAKESEIADVTKGIFGVDYNTLTIDISEYVKDNGTTLTYAATSSNESVVTATVTGSVLSLEFLKDTGSSNITVTASADSTTYLTFNFKASPKKYTKIACVGDSLTAKTGSNGYGYPMFLTEYLGSGVEVGNFGKSGIALTEYSNTPANGSYMGENGKYAESVAFEPDLIIIMLGTNDATKVDGEGELANGYDWNEVGPAYKAAYKALIDSYKRDCPDADIVLMTSPPVSTSNTMSISNDILTNKTYKLQLEAAKENGVKLVDLREYIIDSVTGDLYVTDGVHFNEATARKVAQFVLKSV